MRSHKFLYSREGFRSRKVDIGKATRKVPDTKVGCKAMMKICKKNIDNWIVTRFERDHNQVFVSPSKVRCLRSHQAVSECKRSIIDTFHNAGISTKKIMNVFRVEFGGDCNLGLMDRDYRNELKKLKKKSLDDNAQFLLNYLKRMQSENPSFFYANDITDNVHLANIFWVDARSRNAYQCFGDVVIFDTTYKTNRFKMPFALFTGINHHTNSTLFGCALLGDETESSFVWLLAMHGKHPITIITDQDKAMQGAIASVFPNVVHRFCKWHILKKVNEKLGSICAKHPTSVREFLNCIWTKTIEEFESS
ncbi:protein FAR1-RELATED SEQUENCE 5-like [Amborella trichopoda]|uniref:protein FAR1-RELATED SEQUENCE 5-like n=1 Tax=Amborella trichopoda TaxID=13333 RepID=UPI0005D31FE2|nr:protein FAR1-RELATED SEQUENCE 5-like [Amborella trichopoda]|eukprot:XP_011625659.1 protein FAR1-RELATED SEQUENCE 5-like [Amborella trichopoda]